MTQRDNQLLINRTLRIIHEIMTAPDQTLSFSMARKLLNIPSPSTVSRLLTDLTECGLLRKDEKCYRPGKALEELKRLFSETPQPLRWYLQHAVQRLAAMTRESAAIYVFDPVEEGARLVAKHEVGDSFHYIEPGQVNRNFHRNTFTRVLLAGQEPAQVGRILSQHGQYPELKQIRQLAGQIGRRGLDGVVVEHNHATRPRWTRCVAVCRTPDAQITGAIGITTAGVETDKERLELFRQAVAEQRAWLEEQQLRYRWESWNIFAMKPQPSEN